MKRAIALLVLASVFGAAQAAPKITYQGTQSGVTTAPKPKPLISHQTVAPAPKPLISHQIVAPAPKPLISHQ